jgi:hypothetical protein
MTICGIKAISLSESVSPGKAGKIARSVLVEIFSMRKRILHKGVLFLLVLVSQFSVRAVLTRMTWSSLDMDSPAKSFPLFRGCRSGFALGVLLVFAFLFSARADAELAAFLDGFSSWTKLSH